RRLAQLIETRDLAPGALRCLGQVPDEPERGLQMQAHFPVRGPRSRLRRRAAAVPDRPIAVLAALAVGRQLARDLVPPVAVGSVEALADRLVQAPSRRRREALRDHLLKQGVPEGVARARAAVRPRALARRAQDLLAAYEPVAELLDVLDVGEVGSRG